MRRTYTLKKELNFFKKSNTGEHPLLESFAPSGAMARPQDASLDIQPLSVRKVSIRFFRTLSR